MMIDDILARLRQAHDEWRVPNQIRIGFTTHKRNWSCEVCGEPVYEVVRRAGALFVCRNPQCRNYATDDRILAYFPTIGSEEYKDSDAKTCRAKRWG